MKNILFGSILALALLSLTGCYESATSTDATVKTTKSKCGAGKCGDSKTTKCGDAKKAETTKKCGADGKCGTGKCGTAK